MTHKSENYKISAVKYYLKNKDNAINNKEIPNYLSRSKTTSTGLNEPVKPKFTRSVKGKHC